MNKLITFLLVAVSIVAIASSLYSVRVARHAFRHQEMGRMFEGRHMFAGEDGLGGQGMGERREQHLQQLHDALKLTAAQEPAWKAFTARLEPGDRPQRPDRDEMAKLSAPERMDKALAMMKERESRLAVTTGAVKTFYATLTPEQQKTFNEEFMPHRPQGFGERFSRRWHHGMGYDQDSQDADRGPNGGPDGGRPPNDE